MRKSLFVSVVSVAALMVVFSFVLFAAQQKGATYTGTLVDSKCYLAHGLTGNDHGPNKNCGTLCLKGGTPGGLLTSAKKFYPLLAPSTALAPYVGKEIRVSGTMVSGAINASKVEVNENGNWQEIKLAPEA